MKNLVVFGAVVVLLMLVCVPAQALLVCTFCTPEDDLCRCPRGYPQIDVPCATWQQACCPTCPLLMPSFLTPEKATCSIYDGPVKEDGVQAWSLSTGE